MTTPTTSQDPQRILLRHAMATLAYRGGKALRGAPEGFATFKASAHTRTPGQILAHISDLLEWSLTQFSGKEAWHDSPALDWNAGSERFFAALAKVDGYLASDAPVSCTAERVFQGAIADAFTHVGQISLLRGLAGCPVKGENYHKADIAVGRVGARQAPPRREF
ncbi:MAG: hypothetical protein WA823_04190 [Candidatus Acidiferrales bacterium]